MNSYRYGSAFLFLTLVFLIYTTFGSAFFPGAPLTKTLFKFGLDLVGGTELIYRADISDIEPVDVNTSLETLRDVIERRINVFGVSEPLIQLETAGILSGNEDHRLIVELPGVADVDEAIALIGATPLLEFRIESDSLQDISTLDQEVELDLNQYFESTGLTGRYLSRAQVQFDPTTGNPLVGLTFNAEGRELFADITRNNVGKVLAIFLDGYPLSYPVIQTEIANGEAIITGDFNAEEVRELVRNLNYGALPVPIELISTQSVGATLGERALDAGVVAGMWGFGLIILFLILWYRLPGLIASIALIFYVTVSLALFKLIPVTLTAAGIAGFILSIGMAVDANILIFERMKEELQKGKNLLDSIQEGFSRAWLSIRDSNISSIITAIVLFWVGTSAVKGFALTFGIGVIVSMFTAITVSRTFLLALVGKSSRVWSPALFGTGFRKAGPRPAEGNNKNT